MFRPSLFLSVLSIFGRVAFCQDVTYAPIPATASGLPLNADGYAIQSYGKGAYMVTEGIYQAFFLVSDKGVILVDAPPTIGKNIEKAIRSVTKAPVTHFVYSHFHGDHASGAYLFKKTAKFIGHVDTASQLRQAADKARPLVDVKFDDDYDLRVGNQSLKLSYKGPNHAPGNIFIWAKAQKILMVVDIIFPGWTPFGQLAYSAYIPGWIKAHDQILEYPFDHYIGGHLGRSGKRADVETQKKYVLDLFDTCKKAIELSGTADPTIGVGGIIAKVTSINPGNTWAIFKAYLDVVGKYCADQSTPRWIGKLAAVDVFGVENAIRLVESLRIDYGFLGPFAVQ